MGTAEATKSHKPNSEGQTVHVLLHFWILVSFKIDNKTFSP